MTADDLHHLVLGALALDRLLAATPAWTEAQDAREALDALLAEASPRWRQGYREAMRANDTACAAIAAGTRRPARNVMPVAVP